MAYTTIDKPTDYFNTVLYTGNATTPTNITGVGFQPDWVWIKNRNNAEVHILADVVRGANKLLESNTNDAELSDTNYIKGFSSDGFQIGSEGAVNGNNQGHVAWNWLASNTTASNTQGDIASTVSANTTSGFSIVSYTGTGSSATVGHGLGVTPNVVWVKNRSNIDPWTCYFSTLGNGQYIELDAASAAQTAGVAGRWNNTNPNSTVITFGNNDDVNGNTENYVAYCFAEKKGYSKFGSYTGNGNADGTFVYTGFKPAMVIFKRTDNSASWTLLDNKRDPFNVTETRLFPDTTDADTIGTNGNTDFLSNGIKIRTSHLGINLSGGTYIYMAFAENPFTTSTGIPTTAR